MVWFTCIALLLGAGGAGAAQASSGEPIQEVREGDGWLAVQAIYPDANGFAYLVTPAKPDGPGELRWQVRADGKVSRKLELGPAHEADCEPAGSGIDCSESERLVLNRPEKVVFVTETARERFGREEQLVLTPRDDTQSTYAVPFTLVPPAKELVARDDFDEARAFECFAPGWQIRVSHPIAEPGRDAEAGGKLGPALQYEAARPGQKVSLSLVLGRTVRSGKTEDWIVPAGAVQREGEVYEVVFENKGYRYAVRASASRSAPSAEVRVIGPNEKVSRIPCTAYLLDVALVQKALAGHARR